MNESSGSRWFPWVCLVVGSCLAVFGPPALLRLTDSEPAAGALLVPLILAGPMLFILGALEPVLARSGRLSLPAIMNLVGLVFSIYFLLAPLWLR